MRSITLRLPRHILIEKPEPQKPELLPQKFVSIRYAEDYIDFISKHSQGAAS